ncbi:hypothetical protein N0V83_004714 [Neocucurbitaria cava]|uniref:Uncharacterized protein n=1 Tax=Neocucurbitaria cava TaxID=798079 RepID=A0A9W8YB63_9PLEO|nr:hypothetical protein N0V83_004714 [Neocucurbitaria cava]
MISALNSDDYTGTNGYLELLPCGRGTNNCCLWKEKCGTNGLCIDKSGNFKRQYCFDKNWKNCSSLAPVGHLQSNSNFDTIEYDKSGLVVYQCQTNVFCYGNSDCCSTNAKQYFVDPTNGDVSDATSVSSGASPSATANPTWWAVDSIAVLRATSTLSNLPTSIPTIGSMTATSSPTDDSSTSRPTSSSSESKGLSAGAGVGIGIAALAGAEALAALIWLLLRERKKRRVLQSQVGLVGSHVGDNKDDVAHQGGGGGGEYYALDSGPYVYQGGGVQQRQELEHRPGRHELL